MTVPGSFALWSRVGAGVCTVLFVLLLLAPALYLGTYGVASNASADFMVQRAAPMFGGLALLLWWSAPEPNSRMRLGVVVSACVVFLGIAATGVFHILTGVAGSILWIAIAGEVLFAVILWLVRHR